jgi:hypothetical protein
LPSVLWLSEFCPCIFYVFFAFLFRIKWKDVCCPICSILFPSLILCHILWMPSSQTVRQSIFYLFPCLYFLPSFLLFISFILFYSNSEIFISNNMLDIRLRVLMASYKQIQESTDTRKFWKWCRPCWSCSSW